MSDARLLQKMIDLDLDGITQTSRDAVRRIIEGNGDNFTKDVMKRKSMAAAAFVEWVLAVVGVVPAAAAQPAAAAASPTSP